MNNELEIKRNKKIEKEIIEKLLIKYFLLINGKYV